MKLRVSTQFSIKQFVIHCVSAQFEGVSLRIGKRFQGERTKSGLASFLGSQMSFQNRLIGRSDFSADLVGARLGDQ